MFLSILSILCFYRFSSFELFFEKMCFRAVFRKNAFFDFDRFCVLGPKPIFAFRDVSFFDILGDKNYRKFIDFFGSENDKKVVRNVKKVVRNAIPVSHSKSKTWVKYQVFEFLSQKEA